MIKVKRLTKETDIKAILNLKGSRKINVNTGIGFFDHVLTSLAFWAQWDLSLECEGDLIVDSHHTIEDVAIILGQAFLEARSETNNIKRISHIMVPMDEALSSITVDISNRPYCVFEGIFAVDRVGEFDIIMTSHFFRTFAAEARITLDIRSLYGENPLHIIESMFKGLGIALRDSLEIREGGPAATKGNL